HSGGPVWRRALFDHSSPDGPLTPPPGRRSAGASLRTTRSVDDGVAGPAPSVGAGTDEGAGRVTTDRSQTIFRLEPTTGGGPSWVLPIPWPAEQCAAAPSSPAPSGPRSSGMTSSCT